MIKNRVIKSLCAVFIFTSTADAKFLKDPAYLSPHLKDKILNSPIGDNVNVSVYDFILEEILKHENMSDREIQKIQQAESMRTKGLNKEDKPIAAEIVETPFSHLLATLCKGTEGCASIAIYQNAGVMIGYGDRNNGLPDAVILADKAVDSLGIQAMGCQKKFCDYHITQGIYVVKIDDKRTVAELSMKPPTEQQGKLVGFIRYAKHLHK